MNFYNEFYLKYVIITLLMVQSNRLTIHLSIRYMMRKVQLKVLNLWKEKKLIKCIVSD